MYGRRLAAQEVKGESSGCIFKILCTKSWLRLVFGHVSSAVNTLYGLN